MTKKDYIKIADVVRPFYKNNDWKQNGRFMENLLMMFEADNPRFDRVRFLDYINKREHTADYCNKYNEKVLPDNDGNCSLCGSKEEENWRALEEEGQVVIG